MVSTKKIIDLNSGTQLLVVLCEFEDEVNGEKRQPQEKYQDTPSTGPHYVYTGGFIPFYILMHPNSRTDNYNARDYRWQKQRY